VKRPAATVRMPWDEVLLEPADVSALKAMAAQHPKGLGVLLDKIIGVDRLSFTAGGEEGRRATDFAEGKRWVGRTLQRAIDATLPTRGRGAPPADLPNSPTPSAKPESASQ
jgi:hypothetical protein